MSTSASATHQWRFGPRSSRGLTQQGCKIRIEDATNSSRQLKRVTGSQPLNDGLASVPGSEPRYSSTLCRRPAESVRHPPWFMCDLPSLITSVVSHLLLTHPR